MIIFLEELNNKLQNIVGKKIVSIFYQPTKGIISDCDMFVFNFGNKNIEYSIHAFSFVRCRNETDILLTSSDIFFSKNYKHLNDKELESKYLLKKTLLYKNLNNIKKLLKDCIIKKAHITLFGDLNIEFENNINIEISIDCLYENFEYYRFFEYKNIKEPHYVVCFSEGKIVIDIVI